MVSLLLLLLLFFSLDPFILLYFQRATYTGHLVVSGGRKVVYWMGEYWMLTHTPSQKSRKLDNLARAVCLSFKSKWITVYVCVVCVAYFLFIYSNLMLPRVLILCFSAFLFILCLNWECVCISQSAFLPSLSLISRDRNNYFITPSRFAARLRQHVNVIMLIELSWLRCNLTFQYGFYIFLGFVQNVLFPRLLFVVRQFLLIFFSLLSLLLLPDKTSPANCS